MDRKVTVLAVLIRSRISLHTVTLSAALLIAPVSFSQPSGEVLYRCADLSFLDEMEAGGAFFTGGGMERDAIRILKDQGFNSVRLRLFYAPEELHDGLEDLLLMAARAQSIGLDLILDLHYSDTWADPGHQTKPAAWATIAFEALVDSVQYYTARVMRALNAQGSLPTVVQIGNEITSGMLWNDGRVGRPFDSPEQWRNLGRLLKAGIQGVRSVSGDQVQTMIHIDRGGSPSGARWFFDNLTTQNIPFDIIGLSYYPWWHGTIGDLERTLELVHDRYNKPIMLAEVAYPWTLGWFDDTTNIVGSRNQLVAGFDATPDGQARFMERVLRAMDGRATAGICYWEAAWVAAPRRGSAWENMALFDNHGEILPSARVLGGLGRTSLEITASSEHKAVHFPNPAREAITVRRPASGCQHITIYNILGQVAMEGPAGCGIRGAVARIPLVDLLPGWYGYTLLGPESNEAARGTFVVQ